MVTNILIVEDDQHINQIVYDTLKNDGFNGTQAYSGTEGLLHVKQNKFELIILDLMLPGISGEEFMRKLRTELQSTTPVIVLSAKEKLGEKLNLFDLGADDYVTKPFELEELLARINVLLKRTANKESMPTYRHKDLSLETNAMRVLVKGHALNLTRQEYKIIELLLKHPTRVFTKQDLYELAWDEMYLGEDKTITVHISNIRNKIKVYSEEPYIDTVWGIGFKLSN